MAISKVVVVDGNNLIVRIDRGVAGRGVTDVEPIEIDGSLYLVFTFSDGTTETVGPVGTIQYIGQAPIVVSGSTISLSTVPVNLGGTGQVTANAGFNALAPTQTGNSGKYLKTDGTNSAWDLLDISTADITGVLPLVNGGTGASTASGARTNLGLGTIATQDASNVAITGGSITGITDLAVADGGTGASTASGARTNLNAADQATTISAGTGLSGGGDLSANRTLNIANTTVTAASYGSASNTLTATVNAQGQLTALTATPIAITNTQISGLGTMSTQNANSVAITGGSITGITDLAVADGGTGASDAAGARTNLNAANQATTITAGTGLSGGGDLSANRTIDIANTTVTAGAFGSASNTLTATVNAQGQLTALAATPIAIANTQISGLGTMSTQNSNAVTITGGSITGITDLALADGGTGASNATDARSNLGLGSAAVLNAGVALGVATLDAGGTVPLSQIPASIQGGVSYQGAWNALTNTPTLVSSVGSKGYYYVVSVAGNTNLNGVTDWLVGDWAIYNGTAWEKIDNTDQVASVNGYTGVVVLSNTDVGAPPTSLTISAGTGLTGGGDLSTNRTLSIANTAVSAASYGTASAVPTFTVNGQGQLTAASDVTIAIANTQVSGLGTMSTQNANSVAITGGSITGITDLAIADGGTGASTAPDARTNLGLGTISTQDASSVAITGGAINGTTIGATTPSTVTGTTVTATTLVVNDNSTFGSSNTDTSTFTGRIASEFTPSVDNTYDLGRTSHEWRNLYLSGTGNIDSLIADTADINGGTIDSTAIGSTTPSSGAFTTVTASTAIGIASGGTGQTTANAAFNALAPSQTGNSGKYLTTDGTDTSWASNPLGTVTSVAASVPSFLSIAGSPITTSGTLAISLSGTALPTTSGGTGLTSFTSGGVVYASSSSALATGSALNYSPTSGLTTNGVTQGYNTLLYTVDGTLSNYSATNNVYLNGNVAGGLSLRGSGNGAQSIGMDGAASGVISFTTNSTEGMRLTSTGLGIGTSSPASKLDVASAAGTTYQFILRTTDSASANSSIRWKNSTGVDKSFIASNFNIGDATGNLEFGAGSTTNMVLNSSGNLGLGVTPSAWTAYKVLQMNNGAFFSSGTNAFMGSNWFYDGADKYITSDFATFYRQLSGVHTWATAASGTAGNTISFTQAMTLDASGNLAIGATSAAARLVSVGSNATVFKALILRNSNGSDGSSATIDFETSAGTQGDEASMAGRIAGLRTGGGTSGALTFSTTNAGVLDERARIDSSGNFGLGSSSPDFASSGDKVLNITGSSVRGSLLLVNSSTGTTGVAGSIKSYNGSTFLTSIDFEAAGATNSGQMVFYTANAGTTAERMRITSAGNVGIGTTSPTFTNGKGISILDGTTSRLKLATTATGSGATDGFELSCNGSEAYIYNYENSFMAFGTNNTERARINSSGNLLVGTTSELIGTSRKLSVDATNNAATFKGSTAGSEVINVWNAATSGDNVFIDFDTETSVTSRGGISYNRTGGLIVYATTSDYRAKDIIGPVIDSGALIDSVPVYMGKMHGATQERPMFIAHETPAYAHTGEKDAVDADGNPVYQQMDASALIPVMWAEIQSLRQRLSAANL